MFFKIHFTLNAAIPEGRRYCAIRVILVAMLKSMHIAAINIYTLVLHIYIYQDNHVPNINFLPRLLLGSLLFEQARESERIWPIE